MTTTEDHPFNDDELATLTDRLATIRPDDLSWQDRAKCNDIIINGRALTPRERADLFFPDVMRTRHHMRHVTARQICAGCKVWTDCLAYWLTTMSATQDTGAAAGYVGRCTPDQRLSLRSALRARTGRTTAA